MMLDHFFAPPTLTSPRGIKAGGEGIYDLSSLGRDGGQDSPYGMDY